MNLLYANDRRGAHAPSYYAVTANAPDAAPVLQGRISADLCIIGGGYTGLSAAIAAAEAGLDVVIVDAQRLGWGASGRNGGQLGTGFNLSQQALEARLGNNQARKLWELAQAAKALTRDQIQRYAPDAGYRPGILNAEWQSRNMDHARAELAHLHKHYGYDALEELSAEQCAAQTGTQVYQGGILDHDAGHIHPLRYAFGLARAAHALGVRVFEQSPVHQIEHGTPATVRTERGAVRAGHVIIATNGYGTGLDRGIAAHVMPINNFIVATDPLASELSILQNDIAVADSKFVVNYFRKSDDNRLIFGGGESYGYRFPNDIATKVRGPLSQIYPQLKDVAIEYAWGGTLAITMSRLPFICRPAPNILSASGYSGHGVALSGFTGRVMAEAVCGQVDGLMTLEALPTPRFPGAGALRQPLLALAMTWYALRDRLGI